jgi:GT2 family glycosyltransferase
VRRKAIYEVGGLDERFFMYWEDADWCRRMRDARWQVVYFPGAWLHHYVGASSEKRFLRSALEFHKSAYLLFSKYAPPRLSFLKPLVLGGLSVRLCLLFFLKFLQWLFGGGFPKIFFTKKQISSEER